uniref:Uncharacterized protein n=1 Tax=viral metagenome TaxID=1070528 RepID=A0A6H1ZCR6_9ZZZZ
MEIKYTKGIPICPYCKKPTKRHALIGTVETTSVIYLPIYDETGKDISIHKSNIVKKYLCLECINSYTVLGNISNGFSYVNIKETK